MITAWQVGLGLALGIAAAQLLRPRRASASHTPGKFVWPENCRLSDVSDYSTTISDRFERHIATAQAAAEEFGVPLQNVLGTMYVESNFNQNAQNASGASGLMQLMPGTSASLSSRLGIADDPFDPVSNVRMGTFMLANLHQRFGNWRDAHAAYFAGSGNVTQALASGGLPENWANYADTVLAHVQRFENALETCAV